MSEQLDIFRQGLVSLQAEELAISLFKDDPKQVKNFEAATVKADKLRVQLAEVKKGLSAVNIESTKDISVATVLADAQLAAKGLGGEFQFLKKAAEGFVDLFDRGDLLELNKEEVKGTSEQQREGKIADVVARLKELNDANKENTISTKNYNQALAVNNEKMDSLRGNAVAATQKLVAENALFKQFAGDMQVIGMKLLGATDAEIDALIEAKNARKALTDARDADNDAQRKASALAQRNTDAIKRTSEALKEQIRLFGLTGRARQLAEFKELQGVSPDQVKDFQKDQNTLEQKGIAADIQQRIQELKANTIAFAKVAEEARALAAKSGPDAVKSINEQLVRGQDGLKREAEALAKAIAADLGTAGDQSIEAIRVALVTGAGTIGTQAGTALVAAFKAAVASAIPGLNVLLPPGVPGGAPSTDQQNEDRANSAAEIDAASQAAQSATANLQTMVDTGRLFGPAMEASAQKGSAAIKGLGEESITFGNELKTAFSSIFGSLEDALVGFVQTGKLDFKSLINSIIADLARMVVRMLIIKPLMGFFGGFFGGIFGFSGGGGVGDAFGLGGFASGGLVSENPKIPQKFATGGQVHGPGTGVSDSVNALLSRDEFVVNAAASRPNMAGLNYLNKTGKMPGGGTVTSVSFSPNISVTVNGDSKSAAQDGSRIGKEIRAEMRAEFNEFVREEQKPGGALSKTNEDVL